MVRTSAFGWVARTVLINGSSTGFMVLARCAPSLASLRRTPAWLGEAVAAGAATAGGASASSGGGAAAGAGRDGAGGPARGTASLVRARAPAGFGEARRGGAEGPAAA